MVPVVVTGSYQATFKFTRRTGKEAVSFILPVGDTQCSLVLDSWTGTISGIDLVDNTPIDRRVGTSAIRTPQPIVNGVVHTLSASVVQSGTNVTIDARLDGQRLINWKGSVARLSLHAPRSMPVPHSFGISFWNQVGDVHELTLELKKGARGYRLRDDWKNPLSEVASKPAPDVAKQCLIWKEKEKYYFVSEKPMSLPDSQRLATKLNGRLLTISSAEEEKFVLDQGRGLWLWMAGWRPPDGTLAWRDERNRTLRYIGTWGSREPDDPINQTHLGLLTGNDPKRGWNDFPSGWTVHACIEWGEEYPEDLETNPK